MCTSAVFDLDGTLIDSLGIWDQVESAWVSQRGLSPWPEMQRELSVRGYLDCASICISHFGLNPAVDTPGKVSEEWTVIARQAYSDPSRIPLRQGTLSFLQRLKKLNVKIGIATSNWRELAEIALHVHGLDEFFEVLVTSDEVEHSKPAPDVYLSVAKKLNSIDLSKVIVFEDSIEAALGAKDAGMKIVGVYDPHRGGAAAWPTFRSVADWTVQNSFDEIDPEKLF